MNSELYQNLKSRQSTLNDLGFRAEAFDRLVQYCDRLWKANEELNLFSRKMTISELVDNHIVDCALTLPHLQDILLHKKQSTPLRVADFGSGGGLPVVIYALQLPQIKFTAFEKSPNKRRFLESLSDLTPNLRVAGEIPLKLSDFNLVTARAFKPADVLVEMSRGYFLEGGSYFLLKGRSEKILEEMAPLEKRYRDLSWKKIELKSPLLNVERNLVIIN